MAGCSRQLVPRGASGRRPAEDPPQLDADIPLDEAVLRDAGWRRFAASRTIDQAQLSALLGELHDEPCAHSWKDVPRDESVRELLARENQHRPTILFAYYGIGAEQRSELVAVATVAQRISHRYAYDGFPILARCYVRRTFRGLKLFRAILLHRLAFIHFTWGDSLKGVHLGSSATHVWRTVERGHGGWPAFIHMGHEDLGLGAATHRVRGYILLTQSYQERLRSLFEGPLQQRPAMNELETAVQNMLEGGTGGTHYEAVNDAFRRVIEQAGDDAVFSRSLEPLRELLGLCEAIPLSLSPKRGPRRGGGARSP